MISLYHFLSEFFLDVPTFGIAVLRGIKVYFFGILLIIAIMFTSISSNIAGIIGMITMLLPAFLVSQYFRQRSRSNQN